MQAITAEIIGALAGVAVLLSFVPKDIKLVRLINLVGCVLFVVYGLIIGATWTTLTNSALIGVQVFHLYAERKNKHGADSK